MSSRTRIVVLHMKEIIYTAIFAALAILLIILLIVMFRPSGKSAASGEKKQYTPGVYTSTLTLNNTNLEVEVAVTDSEISTGRYRRSDLPNSVPGKYFFSGRCPLYIPVNP